MGVDASIFGSYIEYRCKNRKMKYWLYDAKKGDELCGKCRRRSGVYISKVGSVGRSCDSNNNK